MACEASQETSVIVQYGLHVGRPQTIGLRCLLHALLPQLLLLLQVATHGCVRRLPPTSFQIFHHGISLPHGLQEVMSSVQGRLAGAMQCLQQDMAAPAQCGSRERAAAVVPESARIFMCLARALVASSSRSRAHWQMPRHCSDSKLS